jgi:tetratricopeptide (TPR) repeat protein
MEKVHEYRSEWKEAITFGKKLIHAMEESLDRFHPSLAPAYNNTAIVLREDGQEEKSIAFSERAMDIVSRSLDPNHIEMAYANWTLANTYDKFAHPAEAVKAISKTLSILEKLLPEDHPNLGMAKKALEEFQAKAEGETL